MADDKAAGGGGSGWGTFEIILVILLAIALLDRISGRKITVTSTPTSTQSITESTPPCGLSLTHPKPLETVSTFVVVSGEVVGCDWMPTQSVALYAQVVDSRGKPMSQYTAVPTASMNETTATFYTNIPLIASPAKGTGYLILVPAVSTGNSATSRIPIKFL